LRRRRRRQPWRLLALLAALAAAVALVAFWCRPDGGGSNPTTARAECSDSNPCTPEGPSQGSDTPPPSIRGRAAAVIEEPCSAQLYLKNPDMQLPPASLAKMMTALVAVDHANLSEVFNVTVNSELMVASTGSSVMGLQPGMQLSLKDLLYGMLLPSGNDAAVEVAQDVAGSEEAFIDMMNVKARELGLKHTHFANTNGLDQAGLYTSAVDIAMIGRAVLNDAQLAPIVRTKTYQPDWVGPELQNGNELLERYPGTIGVKTGYTEAAGQTIVAAAQRNGRTLIVSVLSSYDRYADAIALFDWAFAQTPPACQAAGPTP
jgi:D-alanyl-D-alanine carboxypeptidase